MRERSADGNGNVVSEYAPNNRDKSGQDEGDHQDEAHIAVPARREVPVRAYAIIISVKCHQHTI